MRRCLHIWSALAALLFGFSGDAHFGIRASQQGVRVELTPRLRKVTERDSARNGQDWTGVFDAFGRRLQTTQIVVAKSAALTNSPIIVSHYFDPAVEFLELRVTEGDRTTWKMMGPDANGVYGEMNGTGGFEAIIPGPDLFCPIVSDFRGNVLAVFDGIHNGLLWNSNRVGGFGGVPGYRPMTAGTGGSQTSLAGETAWRNRMTESVGYVWLGANIYDPSSGRFLSFDARGHAASPSGYEFCGGDPINYFDADGRLGVRAGKWAENTYENGVQMFEGLLNPETRLQTVKDGAYGSARGAFNWAVESAQGVNNVVPGSPLGGYLNNQALSYVSGEGNQLINSAGGAYGADPNSPATQTWDSLTRGVLTAGSILYAPGEASGGGGTQGAAIPRGFSSAEEFSQASQELRAALAKNGITDASIGVRGSSVTGVSYRTGGPFGPASDIDFFVESGQLVEGLKTSRNTPGFVHPDVVHENFDAIAEWSEIWSQNLRRKVSVGGFQPGTVPAGGMIRP